MTQRKSLLIGQSDFRKFRLHDGYYVDKSLFIQEIIETGYLVLLLPRPRRFGKTLNLSMLRYFFEKIEPSQSGPEQGQRADLFTGLAIRDTPLFEKHQGRYPVIFLTFKDLKENSWQTMFQGVRNLIRAEFLRHSYILESDVLAYPEKRYFQAILDGKATQRDYSEALAQLSAFLAHFYHEEVVILIDEYDTPILSGYLRGYYQEVLTFMRNLLSGGLKDNEYLYKGVLTGILRVAKESIFSSLNNPGVFTVLSQEFNTVFGFTTSEVKAMLDYYDLSEQYNLVAQWYDGYLFGGEVIYNPWSVLNYVMSKDKQFRSYWLNTGSTELLDQLITRGGAELREELEQLLTGQTIIRPVYDSIVMRDLETHDDLLWSFLVFSGYLKCPPNFVRRNWYELTIPNEEIRLVYEDLVERWFKEKIKIPQLETMLAALEQGDIYLFERMLRMVVLEVMSYHDLSGDPEKVYQALVLGMLVWLSPKYEIRTNREAGYGRYDMMFKPKLKPPPKGEGNNPNRGIILEFKRVDDDQKPETVLEKALQQINDKAYTTELEAAGVTDILRLAVVFRGKEMWLKQGAVDQ
ncbi:AAA family ATPase [Anaerolineales bacterium HSG6]|nr:AAA family ATPase [Anaerolineales bacterium HSG6]